MSLRGNLNSVDLANIFQMLSINQKEGTLNIFDGRSKKSIYFSRDGVSMLSRGKTKKDSLGEILLRYDKIEEEQLEQFLRRQRQSGSILALVIEEAGAVPKEVIDDALRIQIEEEIYNLFIWKDASFEFIEGIAPEEFRELGTSMTRLTFNVNSLIMEAARRIDEWDHIKALIPSVTEIYRYTGRNMELTDEIFQAVWCEKVLASIDARSNVEEIIERSHVGRFEVCRILFLLLEQKAIEAVDIQDLETSARESGARGEYHDAIKYYERIIEVKGNTAETHLQLGRAYEAANELLLASRNFRHYSDHCLKLGRIPEAFQLQQQICEMLPTDLRAAESLVEIYVEYPEDLVGHAPEVIERGRQLAVIYQELGKHHQAIQTLQRVILLATDDLSLRNLLINIYLASGMSSEAITEYEALADFHAKRREWDKVIKVLRKILVIDRERDDISNRLHQLLTRKESRKRSVKRVAFLVLLIVALGALAYAYGTYEIGGQRRAAEAEAAAARAISSLEIQMKPVRVALEKLRNELSAGNVDADVLIQTFKRAERMNVQYESQIFSAIDELKSVAEEFKYSTAHKQAVQKQEELGLMLQRFRQTLQDAGKQIQVFAVELMREGDLLVKRGDGRGALAIYQKAWKVARDRQPLKDNNVPERIEQLEKDLAVIDKLVKREEEFLAAGRHQQAVDTALELISGFIIYPEVLNRVKMPVRVTSDPPGADILVDGQPTGVRTPGWVTYNPREGAQVSIRKNGYSEAVHPIPAIRSNDKATVLKSLKDHASLDSHMRKELSSEQTLEGSVEAAPVVDGVIVYFATRSGKVFRLDARGHKAELIHESKSIGGIKSSPALDQGRLFVVTLEGTLTKLVREEEGWTEAWSKELASMASAPLVVSDGVLLVGDASGRLSAFDVESGELLGRQQVGDEIRSRPVVVDGRVYVVSAEGRMRIFEVDGLVPQAELEAQYEDLKLAGAPVIRDGRLYLRGTNGALHAVDLVTGKRLWEYRFGSEVRGPPAVIEGTAIVSTPDGKIQAVRDGKVTATFELGGTVTNGFSTKGDLVFACNEAGRCVALRYRDNNFLLKWKIDLASKEERPLRILTAPVVAGDMVVLASESGEVFVLSE
jgi:outer membrane protein assembly factor BamB